MTDVQQLRIVSLSWGSVSCEFATRLAADAGLEVIKVETVEGDSLRRRPGHLFSYLAAGKFSVAPPEASFDSVLTAILAKSDAVAIASAGEYEAVAFGSDREIRGAEVEGRA